MKFTDDIKKKFSNENIKKGINYARAGIDLIKVFQNVKNKEISGAAKRVPVETIHTILDVAQGASNIASGKGYFSDSPKVQFQPKASVVPKRAVLNGSSVGLSPPAYFEPAPPAYTPRRVSVQDSVQRRLSQVPTYQDLEKEQSVRMALQMRAR